MKLNNEIAELKLDTSLLVVMGSHHGIIYKIEDDEMTQMDEHRVDTPVYSDNEGMFRGPGSTNVTSGSVLESKKYLAQEDFSKEFAQKIKHICDSSHIKSIYLFAPSEDNSLIESDWSDQMKDSIVERFDGNYTPKQPSELLEMLYKELSEKKTHQATGEAKKILEKMDHIN
jgi:hypothetical protein